MPEFKNLNGKRFGRWTVISYAGVKRFPSGCTRTMWNCVCECGKRKVVQGGNLMTGRSISCGCLTNCVYKLEDYGSSPKILSEKRIWTTMIGRCTNPKTARYDKYGGRGITVCQKWINSFEAFLEDIGPRPSMMHSIDRIDNNGNYEPGNVRWATKSEQQRNQRRTRTITAFGRTMNIYDWSSETGISANTLASRILRGYSPEEAVTTSVFSSRGKRSSACN